MVKVRFPSHFIVRHHVGTLSDTWSIALPSNLAMLPVLRTKYRGDNTTHLAVCADSTTVSDQERQSPLAVLRQLQ